jgi:hypothetical protein
LVNIPDAESTDVNVLHINDLVPDSTFAALSTERTMSEAISYLLN